MNEKPEALQFADDRPSSWNVDGLYQWAIDAEELIRSMQSNINELEEDAMRYRDLSKALRYGLGHAQHGRTYKIVEVCKMYGSECTVSTDYVLDAIRCRNKKLESIADGKYQLSKYVRHLLFWKKKVSAGWISVETSGNEKKFFFTSQYDSHNPIDFGIDNWTRAWILRVNKGECDYIEFYNSTPVEVSEKVEWAVNFVIKNLNSGD